MSEEKKSNLFLIAGGFAALVVAMGVGRFAYTPLMPEMQAQFNFSDDVAGFIASINYLGYLIGAFLCFKKMTRNVKIRLFRVSLIISVITTLSMGLFSLINFWMILRFLGGVASAGIFIIGSSIVMERVQQTKYSHLGILIYSGVGAGIALSSIISPLLISHFNVQITWIVLSFICLPLTILCWFTLIPDFLTETIHSNTTKIKAFEYPKLLPWLVLAYFCEGFGYIVSGTFIVSFLQNQSNVFSSGNFAWTMVGLTASVSVPFFHQMSKSIHPVHILIIAHVMQGIGILIPVFSSHWVAINLGAILFGGTFMGITALSLSIGKILKPGQSQIVIGLLTAVYGVGQILGPLISGILSKHSGSFASALVMSAIVVFIGGIFLTIGIFIENRK
ncbi:MAG: YbfB/YjiJ family MFS transporter [Thermodesulfobacteriota bacterium]